MSEEEGDLPINTAEGMAQFIDFLCGDAYPQQLPSLSELWKAWIAEGFTDEESDEGEFRKGFRLYQKSRNT